MERSNQANPSEAMSPNEKAASVKELMFVNGQEADALFSFGASVKKDERKYPSETGYRTLSFSDLSEHGLVTGSRTRVIATAEIARVMPEIKIVTTSFNRMDLEEPSMARIVKEELLERGVDADQIILEEKSFNTLTQLKEMIELAVENGWSRVVAMTNEYHLPRMAEMYRQLEDLVADDAFSQVLQRFQEEGGAVRFVCSEEIMRIIDSHFEKYIEKVMAMPEYQRNVESEARGLRALQEREYKTPKRIEDVKPGE